MPIRQLFLHILVTSGILIIRIELLDIDDSGELDSLRILTMEDYKVQI